MSKTNTDETENFPKIEIQAEDQAIIDSLYCEKWDKF